MLDRKSRAGRAAFRRSRLGDFVIAHGQFSGFGLPVNWIAVDILRIENGVLVEHWDVIQDEATKEQFKSGNPMFGDEFPTYP